MTYKLYQRLLSWPPLVYLLIFFAVPSFIMLFATLRQPGDYGGLMPFWLNDQGWLNFDWEAVTVENYTRLAEDWVYLELFLKSLAYALSTTLLCLVMGYPLAWLIARSKKKHRDLLMLLVILPFWSNFLVRIYAWMIILTPSGFLTKALNALLAFMGLNPVQLLFTPFAVILCMVYVHLPFMILPLYANLEKHDPALLDAAQDLGANSWQRFWKITFPLSLPGVYAGAALVFIPVLGMFAVPDILGGVDGNMIGNLIKQEFLEARDWPFGSVLSVVLTLIAILLVGLSALIAGHQPKEAR
jgi:spermidine/putrescine transport system permease protein